MDSSSTLLTNYNQRNTSPKMKPPKQKRKTTATSTTTTTTNKPIKVRYISNPMRVETCASKFRELVQELTGQDAADLPHEPTTFSTVDPHQIEISNPVPLDEEISEYYSPLDDEVVFGNNNNSNGSQMSANNLNGFFSNGFYNVNALGSIG